MQPEHVQQDLVRVAAALADEETRPTSGFQSVLDAPQDVVQPAQAAATCPSDQSRPSKAVVGRMPYGWSPMRSAGSGPRPDT